MVHVTCSGTVILKWLHISNRKHLYFWCTRCKTYFENAVEVVSHEADTVSQHFSGIHTYGGCGGTVSTVFIADRYFPYCEKCHRVIPPAQVQVD